MPLSLQRATIADLPRIVHLEYSAFAHDPCSLVMFGPTPSAELIQQSLDSAQNEMLHDARTQFMVVKDTEINDGVIAFAKWRFYKEMRPESEWRKPYEREPCKGTNDEARHLFKAAVVEKRQKIMGGRPYCCKTFRFCMCFRSTGGLVLNLLDVDPSQQRRGAGTLLLRWGMDVADDAGLPCYLEATSAGYHLYQKVGFEAIDNIDLDMSEWGLDYEPRFVCMIRPAKIRLP